MSDEVNNNGSSDATVEAKHDSGAIRETPEQIAQLKEIARKYAAVNSLYGQNKNVKEAIDKAIKGESEDKASENLTEEEEMDFATAIKEIKNLKRELGETREIAAASKKDIDEAKNAWALEFVTSNAVNIDNKYKDQVRRYADHVGVDSSGKQFKYLYKEVIDNAKIIAKDYGLVDKNGNVNPLMKFEPEMIKKAFQMSLKDMEESFDYDPLVRKQKRIMEDSKKQERGERERLAARAKEFAKKNLSSHQIKAKILEEEFDRSLRNKYGLSRKDAFNIFTGRDD